MCTPKILLFVVAFVVIQIFTHTVQAKCYKDAYHSDIATEMLLLVMEQSGLPSTNFEIMASDTVVYAIATTCRGVRYIYVNEEWLSSAFNDNYRDWKGLGTLAHEIGHHILGHKPRRKTHKRELEADRYAGHTLYNLGATLKQAKQLFYSLPPMGSDSHPNRKKRIAAVTAGWKNAKNPTHVTVAGMSFPNVSPYSNRGYDIDAIGYGPTTEYGDDRWHVILTQRERGLQALRFENDIKVMKEKVHKLWDRDYLIEKFYYLNNEWVVLMSKKQANAHLLQSWVELTNLDDVKDMIKAGWNDEDGGKYVSFLSYGDGYYVVIMTQGGAIQEYNSSETYREIVDAVNERWDENFFVTSLTYSKHDDWFLVTTEDKASHHDLIFRESYYPEEMIEFYAGSEYRIAHITYDDRNRKWIGVVTTRELFVR